ncbi:MAG: response regulator [Eubacterium sp.]|nr:response regulator [Eubacterium sp.]
MYSNRFKRIIAYIIAGACIFACLFGVRPVSDKVVYADTANDNELVTDYISTIFSQDNGLGSNEVNCVYQSASGYIWVGTDGGLYRYDGNEFKVFNLWDTEKADVYCVNALFQDSKGRLWIATDNYGLFYKKGNEMQHFSADYYNGIKTINDVTESEDGTIYVAGSSGLFSVDEDTLLLREEGILSGRNVSAICYFNERIWGIADSSDVFTLNYSADGESIVRFASAEELETEELSCIEAGEDHIYIGSVGGDIIKMDSLTSFEKLQPGKYGINSLYMNEDTLYVCTDNGLGYIAKDGIYYNVQNLSIDSYISSMIIDYEGNIWLSSTRKGLLLMARSKFKDISSRYKIPESSVNSIKYISSHKYICTDEGLYILDPLDRMVTNNLTEALSGVGVNDVMADRKGNIWVSTFRRFGVVVLTKAGTLKYFGRASQLPSNQINCVYELSNGKIAVGTSEGIGIISGDEVETRYTSENGLENENITAIVEDNKGRILAGSDGGGLYVIDNNRVTNYTTEQGLTSNYISCITKGENGFYMGTDNGITYYGDAIRALSSIDFSNNVYDIIIKNGEVWVIGSKGVLRTNEAELLGATGVSGRYLAKGDGLTRSIMDGSSSLLDRKGILYICCVDGIETLDTSDITTNISAPKLTVSEIDVDGKIYSFDELGGNLTIPAKTNKITITFGVLTYVNRENLKVSYMLEGFDSEPVIITGNNPMQAVYTNLEGGEYKFVLSAVNADGTESDSTMTFTIIKRKGFFERRIVKVSIIVFAIFFFLGALYIFFKFRKAILGKNKELERLAKEHEDTVKTSTAKNDYLANISNEIKTPINAIISLAESTMNSGAPRSVEEQENLKNIVSQSNDIITKVDGIIRLARLESGRETAVNAAYSITTLVCDISDKMLNLVSERPVKFFVELGNDIPDVVIGDYEKIRSVLMYILDNAQKYTREGSITLTVDCYDYNDVKNGNKVNIIFGVTDTGVGIRKEKLDHLFEVYNINSNKKEAGYSGTGIGLAIAKRLADVMGGDIDVESTYGEGSTFTFSILQTRPEGSIYQTQVDADVIEMVSMEEAQQMWTPDVNVLFVDDTEINATVAKGVMNQMEIKCDVAMSGISAIDMVMNKEYDLVFMDMIMPVMNGTDTMKEIRDLGGEKYTELPVIAMTENAVNEDRESLLDDGFTDVILKPLDRRALATIIMNYVERSKIKYRTSDMDQYIRESRFSEGLEKLSEKLEVSRVLEKIGGNIDVYNKIVSSFYSRNKNAEEELMVKFDSDYRGFRNRVHGIRTSSSNIGAEDVLRMASTIEAAVNIGNKIYVRDNLKKFIDKLKETVEAIGEYLEFIDANKGITDTEFAEKAIGETENLKSAGIADTEDDQNKVFDASELSDDYDGSDEFDNIDDEYDELETEGISASQIDLDVLRSISEKIKAGDFKSASADYDKLCEGEYSGEDIDFMNALREGIEGQDSAAVEEMIVTYINLKS